MYIGKTLFSQIMHFLPSKTFHRLVSRYEGDYRVRTLPCAEHFRILAFPQLTYRVNVNRKLQGFWSAPLREWTVSDRDFDRGPMMLILKLSWGQIA